MSVEEIKRFNEEVVNNEELLEGLKGVGTDIDALVAYANEKGFSFTKEELVEISETLKSELSEDQLDDVVGGGGQATAAVSAVVTTVGPGSNAIVAVVIQDPVGPATIANVVTMDVTVVVA